MELISIIVPVYNVEKYIRRCINSIIKQTYQYLEIILVDDGSTDNSGLICDKYAHIDNRITVIHKKNGGLSSARNTGIDIAKGAYIGFIDSDDWIAPETYEVLYKNLVRYDADVSDIDSVILSKEFIYKNNKEKIYIYEGREILIDYFISNKYSCCRKLYKRSIIGEIKFPVGKINEDITTNYLFLASAKREVKSSLKLYYYFNNPNSITGKVFKKKDLDLLEACNDLIKYTNNDFQLNYLAQIKRSMSYYSLIGRYICYENEKGFYPDILIQNIHRKLKICYISLLKSHITLKKKILISICVIFKPQFLKKIWNFGQKINIIKSI